MEYGNAELLISHLERLRIPDFYVTPDFEDKVRPYISNIALGEGHAASLVNLLEIPGVKEKLVIKSSRPCTYRGGVLDRYCEDITSPTAIRREPHGDKEIIDIPNTLLEGLIGAFMARLIKANLTPHFVPVYGVWSDPLNEVSYTLMPKMRTNIKNIIKGVEDLYLILFQFAQGLSVAQEVHRFTHYDPHYGNWFYSKDQVNRAYPLPSGRTKKWIGVKSRGYTMRLGDYGMARMEAIGSKGQFSAKSMILEPTVSDYPVSSLGVFNRNYDMASIVGSMLAHNDEHNKTPYLNKVRITSALKADIYSIVFGVSIDDIISDIDAFENQIFESDWWRPRQAITVAYFDMPSIHTIVKNLGAKLVTLGLATMFSNRDTAERKGFTPLTALRHYNYIHRWQVIEDQRVAPRKMVPILPGVNYEYLILSYNRPPRPWNWTFTKKETEEFPARTQYIHILYVNTASLVENKYKIGFQCCKLDALDYLSDKYGIAVNGGFFDARGRTYEPIGSYKASQGKRSDPAVIFDNPPPYLYREYYGSLILKNGRLGILPPGIPPEYGSDSMSCGPPLVLDGEITMNKATIEKLAEIDLHMIYLFQCRNASEDEEESTEFLPPLKLKSSTGGFQKKPVGSDRLIPNCSLIKPGELSHAGNSNPRTAVLTRNNTDGLGDLAFIYVEGRDDRGIGVDLVELAIIVHQLGAIDALNLDGGRSSTMAWHTEADRDVIHTACHKAFYPVGDLITIIKQ